MWKTKSAWERQYTDIDEWLDHQLDRERLRGALRKLRQLFKGEKEKRNDCTWWFDVGIRVAELAPKEDRQYGNSVIELLAIDLRPGRDTMDSSLLRFLYDARNFVGQYLSRKGAEDLNGRRNADEEPLTPFHVSLLVNVKDDGQRQDFLERCLAESWSGHQLRREIQMQRGGRRSVRSPPLKPPKYSSPVMALQDIEAMTKQWEVSHKAWFVGQKAPLHHLAVKDQVENTLHKINSARKGLEIVQDRVEVALDRLNVLADQIEARPAADSTTRRRKSNKSS